MNHNDENQEYKNDIVQDVLDDNMKFLPTILEEDPPVSTYTRLPITGLSALGAAFEPLASAVRNAFSSAETTTGYCMYTIPKGTHLAKLKNGAGYIGTVLKNDTNQLSNQAVLNPLVCNPTLIFMAAALANIDKKLDEILELQREMMDFLVRKEKAEQRGNLVFLSDILKNYRFNWNNEMYKNSNHIKVLDIRQASEQKIFFYRDQIETKLQKEKSIHSDRDAEKQLNAVTEGFKEYQLALFLHGFSSFLDVMLLENFESDYLEGICRKIEGYSFEYRQLYTQCYDQLQAYFNSSVQARLLKGLKVTSKAAGKAIANTPILNKGPVDEALIQAGSRLEQDELKRKMQQMKTLIAHQGGSTRPFVENIEAINHLYNNPINILLSKEAIYIGTTAA